MICDKRSFLLSVGTLVIMAAGSSLCHGVLVARYTFDDVDVVGNGVSGNPWVARDIALPANNATAAGANGGANITPSVSGVFNQAWRFEEAGGNNSDLSTFENLLLAPAGTAPAGSTARTFATWFNMAANDADQNKLFGYGTAAPDRTFDIGFEAGGVRLRTFGGNITYGGGLFDFVGSDAGWHHLAVRHDGSATFVGVNVFIDGVLLPVTASGGDALTDAINTSDTAFGVGTTGVVGSAVEQGFTGLIDDFRIYDTALSNQEIAALARLPSLSLEVEISSGRVLIRNQSGNDLLVGYYEISSLDAEQDGGSLRVDKWHSLQQQDLPGVPAGDGTGNGWEEAGMANSKRLGEIFLGPTGQGASLFANDMMPLHLGPIFNPSRSADLSFIYQLVDGTFLEGSVEYISVPAAAGDYNQDGVVNVSDYTVWRDTLGQTGETLAADGDLNGQVDTADYLVWKENFGRQLQQHAIAAAQVPEPLASFSILTVCFIAVVRSVLAAPLQWATGILGRSWIFTKWYDPCASCLVLWMVE